MGTEVSDAEEVAQLVARMQQSRDRRRFDDMADCFTADSTVDVSWFTGSGLGFVAGSRKMAAEACGPYGIHRLSPPTVRVNGNRALVEVPQAIELRVTIDDTEADLTAYVRSQVRAERTDGHWRITKITAVYERDTLLPSIPGAKLEVDPAEFVGYRPSYRCLAWFLNRRGLPARPDLLGDDQPEAVARQYEADAAWLTALQ